MGLDGPSRRRLLPGAPEPAAGAERDASVPGRSGLRSPCGCSCPGGRRAWEAAAAPAQESAAVGWLAGEEGVREAHEGPVGCWGQGAALPKLALPAAVAQAAAAAPGAATPCSLLRGCFFPGRAAFPLQRSELWLRVGDTAATPALRCWVLPPSVARVPFCVVGDFSLLRGDVGVGRRRDRPAAFPVSSSGACWFLCSGGWCKLVPARKGSGGEALARRRGTAGFPATSPSRGRGFRCSEQRGEAQLLVWRT